jgi:ribosomal protein S18 acetylase RimI-like enzyme
MNNTKVTLDDIIIRTDPKPGDLGYVIYRHGKLYGDEYGFGVSFEMYVAAGMFEFYQKYDPQLDRLWICEHIGKVVGFLLLMHREKNAAQLRYFYVDKEYRSIGLGKKLMEQYMEFLKAKRYASSYLWTTHELDAAASLYKKHGFRLTEEKESTSFGKRLKEQRYDLTLGPSPKREG